MVHVCRPSTGFPALVGVVPPYGMNPFIALSTCSAVMSSGASTVNSSRIFDTGLRFLKRNNEFSMIALSSKIESPDGRA